MAVVVDEATLDGPDALPAGGELAAALDALDPAGSIGQEAAAWMRAAFRQRNHHDWLLLRTLREACSARAGSTERVELDEFAPKIAAASLGWSTVMAAARLDLAVGVLERIPALGERMRVGDLEVVKAAAFVTGLEGLTDPQAREAADSVLPDAPHLGLGELRDRILDAGYAVDHVWAADRLAAATARARVTAETAPSGAVNVCGRDLPPELAQDATSRLRALALAVRARLRAAGRPRALGFIEARVFVRLMDGTQAGASDHEVITAITTELMTASSPAPSDEDPQDGGPEGDPDDGGPHGGGPHGRGPHGGGPDDGGQDGEGPDSEGPDDDDPDDGAPDGEGPDDGAPDDGGPEDGGPDDGGPEDDPDDPDDGGSDTARADGGDSRSGATADPTVPGPGARQSVVFAPGIGVRLELSTLLGLDEHPGVLPGLGPVPADTARAAAARHGTAAWQILVHDEHGHLEHLLVLRAPPRAIRDPRHRRRTVQLTAPAALIHALDPAPGASPANDAADPLDGTRAMVLDEATAGWLRRVRAALVDSETADPEDHPATTTRDRDRRFPGTRLAAWVRARDQTCIALGCTRPADVCDLDHTVDWTRGGPTEAGGLDALCRHDHRGKHEAGWLYRQPRPGHFLITDPTGTRHHTESRVVRPRPAPCGPGRGIGPDPGRPPPRPDWAPTRTRDGRITREARATAEHLQRRAREREGEPPDRHDTDPDF